MTVIQCTLDMNLHSDQFVMPAYFCPYMQVTISTHFFGLYMSKCSIDTLYDYQCFMGSRFFVAKEMYMDVYEKYCFF